MKEVVTMKWCKAHSRKSVLPCWSTLGQAANKERCPLHSAKVTDRLKTGSFLDRQHFLNDRLEHAHHSFPNNHAQSNTGRIYIYERFQLRKVYYDTVL